MNMDATDAMKAMSDEQDILRRFTYHAPKGDQPEQPR